jgi:hypothetical protein
VAWGVEVLAVELGVGAVAMMMLALAVVLVVFARRRVVAFFDSPSIASLLQVLAFNFCRQNQT